MGEFNIRIKDLIIKHLKDELTVEQQLELQDWINVSDYNRETFQQLTDPDKLSKDLKEYQEAGINIWDKIDARMKTPAFVESPVTNIRSIGRRIRIYVAAAVLMFIFVSGYIWLASPLRSPSKARPASVPVAVRDVAPGGNKATLTLANGSTIVLENVADGSLVDQGAAHVLKNKDQLAYNASSENHTTSATLVYNTLTTPRAGQFQVVLPDGTKVWLNNASSLRYPTSFSGASRDVELTGEAYFEVAKNTAKPFSVSLPDATVHVLGTSFNVMAYDDEPEMRMTLLKGSVRVSKANQSTLLHPGQQARVKDMIHVINDVDTGEVIAWKNNLFEFNSANIETVMRSIARWYDVSVRYEGPKTNHLLTGLIRRDSYVSDVLQILATSGYHFKVEGKTVIVLP